RSEISDLRSSAERREKREERREEGDPFSLLSSLFSLFYRGDASVLRSPVPQVGHGAGAPSRLVSPITSCDGSLGSWLAIYTSIAIRVALFCRSWPIALS